jgi:FkbM family methyltransferase
MITDALYRSLGFSPAMQRQAKRVLARLPHRERLVHRFGQKLWVDPADVQGFFFYYDRDGDDWILEFLCRSASGYSHVLDVGANIGAYTVFFAARARMVDAFEPDPRLAAKLRRNLQVNSLENVRLHECCIGAEVGEVRFAPADGKNEGIGHIAKNGEPGQLCRCVTLDAALAGIDDPCLVKIDIEGGEWLALGAGSRELATRKAATAILLETHPGEVALLGGSLERLQEILERMGFRVSALTPQGLAPLADPAAHRFWWAER